MARVAKIIHDPKAHAKVERSSVESTVVGTWKCKKVSPTSKIPKVQRVRFPRIHFTPGGTVRFGVNGGVCDVATGSETPLKN